jgi:hypothetical protein
MRMHASGDVRCRQRDWRLNGMPHPRGIPAPRAAFSAGRTISGDGRLPQTRRRPGRSSRWLV